MQHPRRQRRIRRRFGEGFGVRCLEDQSFAIGARPRSRALPPGQRLKRATRMRTQKDVRCIGLYNTSEQNTAEARGIEWLCMVLLVRPCKTCYFVKSFLLAVFAFGIILRHTVLKHTEKCPASARSPNLEGFCWITGKTAPTSTIFQLCHLLDQAGVLF